MVALGSGFNMKENNMRTEMRITGEHVANNQEVGICSLGVDAQGRGGYSSESNTTAKKEYTGHGRSRAICR